MSDGYVDTCRFYGHLEQEPKEFRGFKSGIVVVPSLKLSYSTFFTPQNTVNQFCTIVHNQLEQVHDVYRTPSVSESVSVSCLSNQPIAVCRNTKSAISTDFSKSKMHFSITFAFANAENQMWLKWICFCSCLACGMTSGG